MTFKEMLKRHTIYKCTAITTLLLCCVHYMHMLLSPYIKLLLIWGVAIIAYDLIKKRNVFKMRDIFVLLIFAAICGISALINGGEYFSANIKSIAYMTVGFLTFYAGALDSDEDLVKREMILIAKWLLALLFAITAICFITYILGFSYRYYFADFPGIGYVGLVDGDLGGLFNANVGGALYSLSIILAILFLIFAKEAGIGKGFKVLCFADIFIATLCLSASWSRTALAALVIILGFIAFAVTAASKLKKLLTACAVMLATVLISFSASFVMPFIQGTIYYTFGDLNIFKDCEEYIAMDDTDGLDAHVIGVVKTASESDAVTLPAEADMHEDLDNFLTGRLTIWDTGMKVFAEHPVFGVTSEAVRDEVLAQNPDTSFAWAIEGGGLHNVYLTTLVAYGILGVLPLAFFAFRQIKLFADARKKKMTFAPNCLAAISVVLFMLLCDIMETRILFQMNIYFVIFWLALGYAVYFKETDIKKHDLSQTDN